jgi:hypothetical protein
MIIEHIEKLISAGERALVEDRKLDEYHKTEGVLSRIGATNTEAERIEEYLERLPHAVLLRLEAILFFGRGDGSLQQQIEYYSKRNEGSDCANALKQAGQLSTLFRRCKIQSATEWY